jgi:hypothetical protein
VIQGKAGYSLTGDVSHSIIFIMEDASRGDAGGAAGGVFCVPAAPLKCRFRPAFSPWFYD